MLKQKKSEIQEKFWKHMGLRVDKPKANGSGNTNDGNSARRAISDPEILASITSIDKTFLKNLKIILICISCEFQIDVENFFAFVREHSKFIWKNTTGILCQPRYTKFWFTLLQLCNHLVYH